MEYQYETNYSHGLDTSNSVFGNILNRSETKKLPQIRQRVKENSRLLPSHAVDIMTEWYDRHYSNPYPTYRDCELLAQRGSITVSQVKQWFVNVRRRTQNQFRKTRDTRCTKRKSNAENVDGIEFSKRIKNEPIHSDSCSTLSSNVSNNSEISLPSQSISPLSFNYSDQSFSNSNISSNTSPNTSLFYSSPVSVNNLYSNYYNQSYNYFNSHSYNQYPLTNSSPLASFSANFAYQASPINNNTYSTRTSPYHYQYQYQYY